ncbi:hypothetical protein [Streptomyces sp. NRRL F-5630]|uniref:hypothetical protein n=1 Tax=Streptomyces sp. NRRL F-5630 TaxID=1463864 RepID=UPI003D7327AA
MRVRLTDGHREVEIRTDGTTDDPALLRQIERTARRLYAALPTESTPSGSPFGFGRHLDLDGVALGSQIDLADQDDDPGLDDEDPTP